MRRAFYAAFAALLLALAIVIFAASNSLIALGEANADASILVSLLFPSSAIAYMLASGKTLRSIIGSLGLSKKGLTIRNVGIGLLLFAFIAGLELAAPAISAVTGISFPTNVGQALAGFPLYFFIFSFTATPIDEELLFRGFLVPRAGMLISALLFAALHYISYFSIAEFAAALLFGLASAYALKRTKSLYPSIIGHALVNLLGVAAILL